MTRISFLSIAGLLVAFLAYRQAGAPDATLVGSIAPEFTLPDESGNEVSLADYRGEVVLLNFWATWCAGCVEELPHMMALDSLLADRPFQMLTVSVDTSWAPVRELFRTHGFRVPTLLDPGRRTRPDYRVYGYPETFLIDAEGRVARKYIGWQDWTRPGILAEIEEQFTTLER